MKYFLLLIGLVIALNSNAQLDRVETDSTFDVGISFNDGFKVFVFDCSNALISQAILSSILKNEVIQRDFKETFPVDTTLYTCSKILDTNALNYIHVALSKREKNIETICLVNRYLLLSGDAVSCVVLFSKRKYGRYQKRRLRVRYKIDEFSGRVVAKRDVNISRYAKGYLLTEIKDDMSLVSMDL